MHDLKFWIYLKKEKGQQILTLYGTWRLVARNKYNDIIALLFIVVLL